MAIEIRWRVEDGYSGKARPQSTVIHASCFDAEESDQEIADAIRDAVTADFAQRIVIDLRDEDVDAAVIAMRAALKQGD